MSGASVARRSTSSGRVDDGQWRQVVCTWDLGSQQATIWIGGQSETDGATANDDPGDMTLGAGTRTGQSSRFVGAICRLLYRPRQISSSYERM